MTDDEMDIIEHAIPDDVISRIARRGYLRGIEDAAKVVVLYKRDASFDDSMVGALEHNSNQQNIAEAIRALATKETEA